MASSCAPPLGAPPLRPPAGIVLTSWPDMDREARDEYLVVVQVKDMLGLSGGYSASTTVTVSLTDVNDNGPTFQHRESLSCTSHAGANGKGHAAPRAPARTRLVLHPRGVYLVRVGGLCCRRCITRLVFFGPAAEIKRRQWKNEREREGETEMGMFICSCTCTGVAHWMDLIIHT